MNKHRELNKSAIEKNLVDSREGVVFYSKNCFRKMVSKVFNSSSLKELKLFVGSLLLWTASGVLNISIRSCLAAIFNSLASVYLVDLRSSLVHICCAENSISSNALHFSFI